MAFEVLDDHEQGERVQKWLRENAIAILIGVGLGLLLIFAWQQWKLHHARHQMEAATYYQALEDKFDKKDYPAIDPLAQQLRKDYADTAYAVLAAMRQANVGLARGENDAAREAMEWAYQHSSQPALQVLAATRLAQLHLASGKADEALKLLDALPKDIYLALANELRGDALLALGRKDEAKTAYTEALTHLDPNAPNRSYVEMKLNELGMEARGS